MTGAQKRAAKAVYLRLKWGWVRRFASYDPVQLGGALRALGISRGNAVLMHSSFSPLNGFDNGPARLIDCVLDVIGPRGHLMMMSMCYRGSSHDFVMSGTPFDVRRTVSHMGIVSEVFRRRQGVLRSANPLHPVLAWGPNARDIIAGHDRLEFSCGSESPFERMLELDTKILLFDVTFQIGTFAHYLEHRFRDLAPVPLYHPESLDAILVDEEGRVRSVRVRPFSQQASARRDLSKLTTALRQGGFLKQRRIGNTKLTVLRTTVAVACATSFLARGGQFYSHQS